MLVWDFPTRTFHWLLVISFSVVFLTSEFDRYLDLHLVFGYSLLGLIAFRLVWGLLGTRYSRFSAFIYKPSEIISYVRSLASTHPDHYVGHNPLGSLGVFSLLVLGILAALSGVLLFNGPGGDALEEIHEIVSYAMLLIVGVHIVGVLGSSWLHKENLVLSMITGYKNWREGEGIQRSWLWLGILLLVCVLTFWVAYPATGLVGLGQGTTQMDGGNGRDDDDDDDDDGDD